MSAALILRQAQDDGLELRATPRGTIEVQGPRAALARWTPIIIANKPDILRELATPSLEERRASVERQLAEMAESNERSRYWWTRPPEGWRDGRLEIRSLTGESTIIRFRKDGRS